MRSIYLLFWATHVFFLNLLVSGVRLPEASTSRAISDKYHHNPEVLDFKPATPLNNHTHYQSQYEQYNTDFIHGFPMRKIPIDPKQLTVKDTGVKNREPHALFYSRRPTNTQSKNGQSGTKLPKRYTYRPHLWTQVNVENCYHFDYVYFCMKMCTINPLSLKKTDPNPPTNLLTPAEVHQYEDELFQRIPQSIQEQQFNKLGQQWWLRSMRKLAWRHRLAKRNSGRLVFNSDRRNLKHGGKISEWSRKKHRAYRTTASRRTRSMFDKRFERKSHSETFQKRNGTLPAEITIHRLLIRPKAAVISGGNLHVRMRYVIQLHKKLTGYYRLIVEIGMGPKQSPLYRTTVQNVCLKWSPKAPEFGCLAQKPRLYQNEEICLCDMPAGMYQQRLRIDLPGVLEGFPVPSFLINMLFQGRVSTSVLSFAVFKTMQCIAVAEFNASSTRLKQISCRFLYGM
ncbi:hypothetical protein P879_00926 [Paragonimus westermani]|uniref:DUF5739 domain-containing protein n=1 Tax=Paragonimus westermani TaxID=34504 RepID=A0A8T0DQN3_9TREM|nr:hypothetical protein P879_00926 [Paragonimus westermani]